MRNVSWRCASIKPTEPLTSACLERGFKHGGQILGQNRGMLIPSHADPLVLGGGCFWCAVAVFVLVKGVLDVESRYCNGQSRNPT
jgi:hypothetical protein